MKHYYFVPQQILFNEAESVKEIQLFRVGTFYDERYGKVDITKDHLVKMTENFDLKVRGVDLALDFSHNSDGPAAGWIKSLHLKNEDKELWAEIEWTKLGEENLKGKEYRYVSPDFTFAYKDNETLKDFGPLLLGAGLTNRPVIKSMAPAIALTEYKESEMEEELKKQLAEKDAKLKEMSEKIAAMEAGSKEVKAEEGSGDEGLLKQISEAKAKIAELEAKLSLSEKEVAMAEKSKKFDLMLSEGKVCEAQRDAFLKDDMTKFLETAQPVKLSEVGNGGKGKEVVEGEDAQDKVLTLAVKMSEEKKVSVSDAIKMVLSEDKDLRAAYEKSVQL